MADVRPNDVPTHEACAGNDLLCCKTLAAKPAKRSTHAGIGDRCSLLNRRKERHAIALDDGVPDVVLAVAEGPLPVLPRSEIWRQIPEVQRRRLIRSPDIALKLVETHRIELIKDFGVARITDNNRTKTGIVLGTPMYMSPEQLAAENLTGHSDLFSLGVTLYELLIGEVPFKAGNIAALMAKITTHDPAPLAGRRAGLSTSIDAVLAKALAKRPADRFSCGAEMAIALRNCARYS